MSPHDRDVLDFERQHPGTLTATKARAIRERFGLSPLRYFQLVRRIGATPEAAAYAPEVVRRLGIETAQGQGAPERAVPASPAQHTLPARLRRRGKDRS